eukprot:gene22657-29807_t
MMPAGEYAISVTNLDTGRSIATAVVVRYAAYLGTPPTVTSTTPIIQPKHLLGGDALTINGTAFGDGATVSIGGDTCTDVFVAGVTSITCVAPPSSIGTTLAAVVVTNPDTGYNVATTVVVTYATYSGDGKPTVTSVSPITAINQLHGGGTITITGSKFLDNEGSTTVTVGDVVCTRISVTSDTRITCGAPSVAAGSYPVVVTIPDTGYSTASLVVVTYTAYGAGE